MFNQSISKFSSSKLTIAVSAAVVSLLFSSVSGAVTLSSGGTYLTGSAQLPAEFLVGEKGAGIVVTAPSVEIKGDSLSISTGTEPITRPIYGLFSNADTNFSVSNAEFNLSSYVSQETKAVPVLTGVYVAQELKAKSSLLKISLSSESEGAQVGSIYGLLTRANTGNLSISDTNLDLTLKVSEGNTIDSKAVVSGIQNAGVFSFKGADSSLNISGYIGKNSTITGGVYGIYNNKTGEVVIEAKEVNLTLELGSGVTGQTEIDPSPVAAICSYGGNVSLAGEKAQITLIDDGQGSPDRINYGIYATSGVVDVSAKSLVINGETSGAYIYGILSQGRVGPSPSITVNSDTKIVVGSKRKENSYGLIAFAGGKITVNGNLEVQANKAIAIRGGGNEANPLQSQITINNNEDKTVKLYGDIDFNLAETEEKGQNVEQAKILVKLVGPDSVWEGHSTITAKRSIEGLDAEEHVNKDLDLEVYLKDGAKWIPDNGNKGEKDSINTLIRHLDKLKLDNGVIELTSRSGDVVEVTELRGTGGEVHAHVSIDENSNITSNKLSIKKTEGTPSLAVHAEGITADDVKDRQAAMESFYANALFLDKEATANTELHIPEGEVAGKLRATVDSEDNVTVQEDPHTISSSVLSIASSNYLLFRSQINDVASRLGDLRSMPKTAGGWVRYYGGQNKYSDRGMKEDYNTIQIGGDGFIADKYYLGGTFSYTDGNGTLVNGSSDDKNYNFGIYGGWLGEKGQFVDVIVKRHRIKSDFDLFNALGKSSGSYRTWGTSASIEAGWRLQCPANGFYAEPQAEFMLGHVESVNYKTNRGVRIHQDGINSAIGRVGVAFGYTFPENKGNAYAKASVLHDWKGDVKASYSKDGVSRRMHDDLGGTWGEFAVGATYNPIKNLSAYGQFKTTTGSPIRTPWQASIGVRYSF